MVAAVGLLHQKPLQTGFLLGYLGVRAQRAQVALQVSVGHQLHHHQGGLAFGHNAQQTHLRGEDKATVSDCSYFISFIRTIRHFFSPTL